MNMNGKIDALLKWLYDAEGFQLSSKIGIHENETAGRGVVLHRDDLKTNELVISVPPTHQLNFNTVLYHLSMFNERLNIPGVTFDRINEHRLQIRPKDPRFQAYRLLDQDFLLNLTSFQLLTLYILFEWYLLPKWSDSTTVSFWKPFFDVWPSKDELKAIPTLWNLSTNSKYKNLLEHLPLASRRHYLRISSMFKTDWEIIQPVLEKWISIFNTEYDRDKFLEILYRELFYIYFVINSRCLYAEIFLKKKDISSKFTMVPYVDFLNHTHETDIHCYPKITKKANDANNMGQFEVLCGTRAYQTPGEEIFFNYGAHSNDFLLNEYGFTLKENRWDCIDISEELMEMMDNQKVISFLVANDYWDDYTINYHEISYRVIIALSLAVTQDYKRVEKLLLGYISEDYFLPKIKAKLRNLLVLLERKFQNKIDTLQRLSTSSNDSVCAENILTIYEGYMKIIWHHLENF